MNHCTDLLEVNVTELIEVGGRQGVPGPVGSGSNIAFRTVAGEDLERLRIVRSTGDKTYYADAEIEAHAGHVLGVTDETNTQGLGVDVIVSGTMREVAWNWGDGPIYLGSNGNLTQSPSATGFIIQIGVAISDTEMFVNVQQPILRA